MEVWPNPMDHRFSFLLSFSLVFFKRWVRIQSADILRSILADRWPVALSCDTTLPVIQTRQIWISLSTKGCALYTASRPSLPSPADRTHGRTDRCEQATSAPVHLSQRSKEAWYSRLPFDMENEWPYIINHDFPKARQRRLRRVRRATLPQQWPRFGYPRQQSPERVRGFDSRAVQSPKERERATGVMICACFVHGATTPDWVLSRSLPGLCNFKLVSADRAQ